MESIAASHNHSILLLDELGLMDAREAGLQAYVIAGGQGKARLNPGRRTARVSILAKCHLLQW